MILLRNIVFWSDLKVYYVTLVAKHFHSGGLIEVHSLVVTVFVRLKKDMYI